MEHTPRPSLASVAALPHSPPPSSAPSPQPTALIPWIWNLGLGGAEVWIYHRLEQSDPRLSDIQDALRALEPFPCDMRVRLQQLLPNKGREAAVYLTHIVNHYNALPQAMVLVHDHGPAARHSLCGPFFRRVRGYYIGVREQLKAAGSGSGAETGTVSSSAAVGQAGGAETAMVAGVGGRGGGAVGAAGPGGGSRRALLGSSRKRGGASSTASSSRKLKVLAAFANMTVSLSSGCQVRVCHSVGRRGPTCCVAVWASGCLALKVTQAHSRSVRVVAATLNGIGTVPKYVRGANGRQGLDMTSIAYDRRCGAVRAVRILPLPPPGVVHPSTPHVKARLFDLLLR